MITSSSQGGDQMDTPAIRGWRPRQLAQKLHPKRRYLPLSCAVLLLICAFALLLHPVRAVQTTAPVPQPSAHATQAAVFPPEHMLLGIPGETVSVTMPTQHLLKGRMLHISNAMPLPEGWRPPDALNVLAHTGGQVTCRDHAATLSEDALAALKALFAAALNDRVIQLTVFAGARSQEQQRQLLTDTMDLLSRDVPLSEALTQAQRLVASPGCSEHQTGRAVDIRVTPRWDAPPEHAPLAASKAGQWLERNAWRFGFIRRYPDAQPESYSCRAYHFRYVGRAHAMIMHELGTTFEEYLALLRQYGSITLVNEENAPLATAVCCIAGERSTAFTLPEGASVEDASLDNTGWAVVSCLYE